MVIHPHIYPPLSIFPAHKTKVCCTCTHIGFSIIFTRLVKITKQIPHINIIYILPQLLSKRNKNIQKRKNLCLQVKNTSLTLIPKSYLTGTRETRAIEFDSTSVEFILSKLASRTAQGNRQNSFSSTYSLRISHKTELYDL